MVIPKINSSHGSETRNIINAAIDSINMQGKSIQKLVAEGQLTPTQYATLIQTVNGLISKGHVKPNDLSPELLELINNSDGTPFNILSIPRDNSVTPDKTTFLRTSSNLINLKNLSLSKTIVAATGELRNISASDVTDFILIEENTNYTFTKIGRVAFYRSDHSFIVGSSLGYDTEEVHTIMSPEDAYYIRFVIIKDDHAVAQANKGLSLLPYEPYHEPILDDNIKKTVRINEVDFITESKEESSLNLFDKEAVTTGGYYDATTLEWVSDNEFLQSEFISVKQGDEIKLSETPVGHMVVLKNAQNEIFNGFTVGSVRNRTFIVPANAVSFSVNGRIAHSNNFMITKNREMPETYAPFGSVDFSDVRLKESMLNYVRENIVINETTGKFKKINFMGDSITRGFEPLTGGQLTVTWASLVAREFGATERNYGLDSSNLAGTNETTMVSRYPNMENDADLVIVSGGTNDWRSGVSLGTIDDTEVTTFYGALKEMMDGLYTKYPNSTIVFCTPLHRVDDKSNTNGVDLKDFRNAIVEVGEMYGVAVIDLYATSGIYPDNTINHDTYVPDGRHPNVEGHRKMASRIIGFLKTL